MEAYANSPPQHILGYAIRSHTRIYVSYLIPAALELAVYITQIVADAAVSYQHFHTQQPEFGWATLLLILIPPFLTFVFVLTSKEQWANPQHADRMHFLSYQLLQMLLFPFFAVYRFGKRIFWATEALFHDDDDCERMECLAKAEECSTCELYHLIQAYGQSAPQIILQLYHMLTQDLFRDFETTSVQAISLVFSAIDLAAITTAYQRFESQHQVGRHYPWSPPQEVEATRQILEKSEHFRNECMRRKRDSQKTITSFPESDKIMANFKAKSLIEPPTHSPQHSPTTEARSVSAPITHDMQVQSYDEVDVDGEPPHETTVLLHNPWPEPTKNATDDDKAMVNPKPRLNRIHEEMKHVDDIEAVDTIPDSPAPLPPNAELLRTQTSTNAELLRTQTSTNSESTARYKRASRPRSQLDIFKDMLIVNAQLYIKEHVPHPPKMLISRVEDEPKDKDKQLLLAGQVTPPLTPHDAVDFFLPRPTKIVNGIQQDDFAGKTIAFFGWISFVIMRMLSLATFCVFFPKAFFIILSVHYVAMLLALCMESRFKGSVNRLLFYLLLAYVYIFVLLEFRIRFKRVRLWYIGYFVLTMVQNITMTMLWYAREEFESWWFGFIFEGIIYSGILLMATLIVYYYLLRPKDVTLVVDDDENTSGS